MSIRVELVQSLERLASMRSHYHAVLNDGLPGRSFFYRIEQLQALATIHAGTRRSLFFLLAWHGDTLVGVLPLVRETKPWSRARVRRLMLWGGDGTVMNIDGDVPLRGTHEECARTVQAFRAALAGPLANQFDELELGYLRADARALPLLEQVFHDGTWSAEPLLSYSVDLQAGAEAWRGSRSRERMRNIGRLRRRLEELGPLVIEERASLTAPELARIAALHGKRQVALSTHGKSRELPFSDPARVAAITALLEGAAAGGHARHQLLFVGDTLVAFLLSLVEGTTMFAWLTSMHDDYAAYSPGATLFREAIEREFTRGALHHIELGVGHTFLKDTMASHTAEPRHLVWQPPNRPMARFRVALWRRLVRLRRRTGG